MAYNKSPLLISYSSLKAVDWSLYKLGSEVITTLRTIQLQIKFNP